MVSLYLRLLRLKLWSSWFPKHGLAISWQMSFMESRVKLDVTISFHPKRWNLRRKLSILLKIGQLPMKSVNSWIFAFNISNFKSQFQAITLEDCRKGKIWPMSPDKMLYSYFCVLSLWLIREGWQDFCVAMERSIDFTAAPIWNQEAVKSQLFSIFENRCGRIV